MKIRKRRISTPECILQENDNRETTHKTMTSTTQQQTDIETNLNKIMQQQKTKKYTQHTDTHNDKNKKTESGRKCCHKKTPKDATTKKQHTKRLIQKDEDK